MICVVIYSNKKTEMIEQPTFSFCLADVNKHRIRYVLRPPKHGQGRKGKKKIHTSKCNKSFLVKYRGLRTFDIYT